MRVLKDTQYVVYVQKNLLILDYWRHAIYVVIEAEKNEFLLDKNKNTMVHVKMTVPSLWLLKQPMVPGLFERFAIQTK